jgi:hypothetical protein
MPSFKDRKDELEWHWNNLNSEAEGQSVSARFFRKYIDDDPDTVMDDLLLLSRECGNETPLPPALVELDRIARLAGSKKSK